MTQHKGIHKNCFKNFGGGIARFARSWLQPWQDKTFYS